MPTRMAATPGKPIKRAAKDAPVARPPAPRSRSKTRRAGSISPEDRNRYVAEAAYFKAERRGFVEGCELADWIEAEAEIDALLDSRGAG